MLMIQCLTKRLIPPPGTPTQAKLVVLSDPNLLHTGPIYHTSRAGRDEKRQEVLGGRVCQREEGMSAEVQDRLGRVGRSDGLLCGLEERNRIWHWLTAA